MKRYDVLVIGGGPAGLSASLEAEKNNAKTCLIEREERLGGILKQCIHDGFGLMRYGEKLSGPEYVIRDIDLVKKSSIDVHTSTFVTKIKKEQKGFYVNYVSKTGIEDIFTKTIIFATGCRERTAKQVMIHGSRPAGVFTAGQAQNLVNLHGLDIAKNCVILGSGDIGLIMARRLTLEGANVKGVYEIKSEPSGLSRNISQCLNDYNIPLHLSTTVTRLIGHDRLEAVEIMKVDENLKPIEGTSEIIPCDALILSVGLIPENELAEYIGVEMDRFTKGPKVDNTFMTNIEGVFSSGNALHVNDLVDYVSENGKLCGKYAANFVSKKESKKASIVIDKSLGYIVPQELNLNTDLTNVDIYFRSFKTVRNAKLTISIEGEDIFTKGYTIVRPPEMQKLNIDFTKYNIVDGTILRFSIKEKGDING